MSQASAQDPFRQLSLKDRVIIVTGAGSGIGASAARLAASRGAAIIAADINGEGCESVAADIRSDGGEVTVFTGDLAAESDVRAMVALALRRYGKLHGAFNNAGITSKGTPLTDMPLEEWQRMIDINLTSVFLCLKHEIAHLKQNGGGAIVNTSSGAGVVGFPGVIDYCSAKHGVVGLTRAAAIDYAAHGVRVNAVLPGGIETPMLKMAMAQDPNIRPAIEAGHLVARLGQPIEIAEAVVFLLSDAASFITGAAMAVDGGYTCR